MCEDYLDLIITYCTCVKIHYDHKYMQLLYFNYTFYFFLRKNDGGLVTATEASVRC